MRALPDIAVLHGLRRARVQLARAFVVLFAATWLGLAVQPCMAEAVPADAATAPAPMEHHAGGCGGEAAPEPQGHDCPHCARDGAHAGDCGTALECDAIGVPAMVGKPAEPPQADLGAWIDLPVHAATPSPMPAHTWARAIRHPPRAPPRALQPLYCSFIE